MTEPTPTAPPLRLTNAFSGTPSDQLEKCYYTVPRHIHTYFFRHLFASEHGTYQKLVSTFIHELYLECQRRGLVGERACWDPSNESIVAGILRDLNFSPASVRPPVPDTKRSPRKRRTASGSDVPPRQPKSPPRDG